MKKTIEIDTEENAKLVRWDLASNISLILAGAFVGLMEGIILEARHVDTNNLSGFLIPATILAVVFALLGFVISSYMRKTPFMYHSKRA